MKDNKIKAIVRMKTGELIEMKAEKISGYWRIGGDKPDWKIYESISIISNNKIYKLQGSRLIFQDNYITQEQ
jgi:hypothetical protein